MQVPTASNSENVVHTKSNNSFLHHQTKAEKEKTSHHNRTQHHHNTTVANRGHIGYGSRLHADGQGSLRRQRPWRWRPLRLLQPELHSQHHSRVHRVLDQNSPGNYSHRICSKHLVQTPQHQLRLIRFSFPKTVTRMTSPQLHTNFFLTTTLENINNITTSRQQQMTTWIRHFVKTSDF